MQQTYQLNDIVNTAPKVTIGVMSYNRLNYLRATLESARRCIRYPNIEWVVVDGASKEPGLRQYLESCQWINKLEFLDASSTICQNRILELAQGDYIMLWPDDVQFTSMGDWLTDYVEVLSNNPWIGSIIPCALRRGTIDSLWGIRRFLQYKLLLSDLRRLNGKVRLQRHIVSSRGEQFISGGWCWPRVVGSGIVSFSRMALWRELGPWKATKKDPNLIDSSSGGEDDMLTRATNMKPELHVIAPLIPVSADIIDDDLGCKAKVRAGRRYGRYTVPTDPDGLYYELKQHADLKRIDNYGLPLNFEEIVTPIGFKLPFDNNGNLPKASMNTQSVADLAGKLIENA